MSVSYLTSQVVTLVFTVAAAAAGALPWWAIPAVIVAVLLLAVLCARFEQ